MRCVVGLALCAAVSGCAASGSVSPTASADGEKQATRRIGLSGGFIYVTNQQFGTPYVGAIEYYAVGSNGDVPPAGSITGSSTLLTQTVGIAVDGSGEIFATNADTNSIVGFPAGSNGDIAPNIVIQGAATGLASPLGLALDDAGNLYVANCGTECDYGPPGPTSVEEFAPGSNGNVAPVRTISGGRTQLGQADGIAVDAKGDLYVGTAKQQTVTVYGPGAHGDSRPIRVISGVDTRINGPDAVAIDGGALFVTSLGGGYVERFGRKASGDASPRARLHTGYATTTSVAPGPDDTIYVSGLRATSGVAAVAQFRSTARGHAAPLTVISGPTTQLVLPLYAYVR